MLEQPALGLESTPLVTAGVSAEPVARDDPMAGDDQRNGISAHDRSDAPGRHLRAAARREPAVGDRLPLPDRLVEGREHRPRRRGLLAEIDGNAEAT